MPLVEANRFLVFMPHIEPKDRRAPPYLGERLLHQSLADSFAGELVQDIDLLQLCSIFPPPNQMAEKDA
jgi:hypothetical protein